ncbi:hypothetical protein [Paraburkholderia hospita]|uniref:hypothetical protein n=1 Tax=Paraburkholderia hospita TaxID=169430 RepID=UPI001177E358|nr:hypothetical protein [Paraburkholderia hospita]
MRRIEGWAFFVCDAFVGVPGFVLASGFVFVARAVWFACVCAGIRVTVFAVHAPPRTGATHPYQRQIADASAKPKRTTPRMPANSKAHQTKAKTKKTAASKRELPSAGQTKKLNPYSSTPPQSH